MAFCAYTWSSLGIFLTIHLGESILLGGGDAQKEDPRCTNLCHLLSSQMQDNRGLMLNLLDDKLTYEERSSLVQH